VGSDDPGTDRGASTQSPDATFSLVYPEGGYYVFTDRESHATRDPNTFYALLRNGPTNHGHPHADLLSFVLFAQRQVWLTDTGKYTYNECPERRQLKGTGGHNTVVVDGMDQTEYRDRMSFATELRYRTRAFEEQEAFVFFDGEHYGYRRLPMPVDHRRQLIWIREAGLLIVDRFAGSGAHRFEQCWQIPRVDGITFETHQVSDGDHHRWYAVEHASTIGKNGATGVVEVARDGHRCRIVPAQYPTTDGVMGSSSGIRARLSTTWHSPAYGQKETGFLLRYELDGVPPQFMATWIEIDSPAEAVPEGDISLTAQASHISDSGLRVSDLDTQSNPRLDPDQLPDATHTPTVTVTVDRPGHGYRVSIGDRVESLDTISAD
jgi:hypothetical protein